VPLAEETERVAAATSNVAVRVTFTHSIVDVESNKSIEKGTLCLELERIMSQPATVVMVVPYFVDL
jgi:hypothetical protein